MKTISYDLAKAIHDKAEEKGLKLPESEMIHFQMQNSDTGEVKWTIINRNTYQDFVYNHFESYPAYTTDELLEILPVGIGEGNLTMYKSDAEGSEKKAYVAEYRPREFTSYTEIEYSLSEALGKLYLYLIDKGLIK